MIASKKMFALTLSIGALGAVLIICGIANIDKPILFCIGFLLEGIALAICSIYD